LYILKFYLYITKKKETIKNILYYYQYNNIYIPVFISVSLTPIFSYTIDLEFKSIISIFYNEFIIYKLINIFYIYQQYLFIFYIYKFIFVNFWNGK